MEVFKVVLRIMDFDKLGGFVITQTLENGRYPNHCISPEVVSIESRDIGEWSDDHPLNHGDTALAEFNRLFSSL